MIEAAGFPLQPSQTRTSRLTSFGSSVSIAGNQTCITYSGGVYYQQDGRYEKDVDAQTNDSTEAIIVTSNSCITGGVDKGWSATDDDCLAENMIIRNKHCAVAVLMNTRFGWTYPFPEGMIGWTDAIIRWYYRKLFETNLYRMGAVVAAARDELSHHPGHRWYDGCRTEGDSPGPRP